MLLQMPIPGGPELLIILLVMALLVGVPVVLAGVILVARFVGGGEDDVAELRARIEELEAQVAAENDAGRPETGAEDQGGDEA
jgi:sec-independent protein translocase protein TatA